VKVKLGENLPTELLGDLRVAGHEADSVHDEALTGAPDSTVLDRVRRDGRVLLTLDKGIANVRAYPPERHAGIVLFRPGSMGRGTTLAFVRHHLPAVLERDLTGRLVVVTDRGLRLR
jgi:predicted nuclease of predicted toxin-antitoxin system